MNGSVDKYQVKSKHPRTGRYDRWRIRWDLPAAATTGTRRQGSRSGFPTKREAETELATVLGQLSAGTYVAPSRERLSVYLAAWLDGIRVKPTTRDNYRTAILVHTIPRIGGVALADLRAEHVDGLYRDLERQGKRAGSCRTAGLTCQDNDCSRDRHAGLAPKSVRHVHIALRKALQDAVDRGYLARNVADLAHPPSQRSARGRRARDKAWPTEQLRAFLEASAHERLAPIWQLASTTGLRRAELVGLRWVDVDLDRGTIRVARTITEVRGQLIEQDDAKTDAAERSFALDARTIESLRRWRIRQTEERLSCPAGVWVDSGLVFTRPDGSGHRPKRLSSAFTALVDRLDLPRIGVHGLRHSYATAALRAGVSPDVVSKRLGHASVVVTLSIYAHVFEQDDQAAAERAAHAIYGS